MTSANVTTSVLSQALGTNPAYRAHYRRRPAWTKLSATATKSAACGECAQLQHQTRGAAGRGDKPRERRAFAGEPDSALLLCIRHAEAWRDRDQEDMR